ncbi:MAG TPA: ribulose-phosphate 3-epimerase [Planctomycetota bacterium]|nr:ribulose-phosphate 3-epimerase [Planctomycetota bacterium]
MSMDSTIKDLKSGKLKTLIAPSVLSADFTKLKDELQAIEAGGADWLHVDVMDGDFVPNLTMGPFIVEALKKMTKLPLDVHLMIQKPERYIKQFADAGAEMLTVHPEAEGFIFGALDSIKELGVRAGMAIKPATPVSVVSNYIKYLDMLLIMTVNPGFSGQKMIKKALPKYQEARKLFGNDLLLEIDGGVMPDNVEAVRDAGVQVIVAATAVFKAKDYAKEIKILRG